MRQELRVFLLILFTKLSFGQVGFQRHDIAGPNVNLTASTNIVYADIDGDGAIDILSSSPAEQKLAWLKNNGNGNFSNPKIVDFNENGFTASTLLDIDNDGDIDILAIGNNEVNLVWYDNIDGLGSFGSPQVINEQNVNDVNEIIPYDFNLDGFIDILFSSESDDKVVLVMNQPNLGFIGDQIVINDLVNGVKDIAIADLDNDNDMDIISASSNNDKIAWYENLDGLGDFSNQQIITSSLDGVRTIDLSDIDGDGRIDIIAGTSVGEVVWYRNLNSSGNFSSKNTIATGSYIYDVFGFDKEGDGDTDVLILDLSSGDSYLSENLNGLGQFSLSVFTDFPLTISPSLYRIESFDVDNDGLEDIVFGGNVLTTIGWQKNVDGLGTYNEYVNITKNSREIHEFDIADIDNDGDLDIAVISQNDDEISWYEHTDGNGLFEVQHVVTYDVRDGTDIRLADIDNNGTIDMVVASTYLDRILVYKNLDGQGNFSDAIVITDSSNTSWASNRVLEVLDIDDDGDLDILSGGNVASTGEMSMYLNIDGQGNFGSEVLLFVNSPVKSIRVGDINGDGIMDFVTTGSNESGTQPDSTVGIWINNGSTAEVTFLVQNGYRAEDSYLEDIDGDGDLDLVVGYVGYYLQSSKKLVWFENLDGLGDFGPEQVIQQPTSAPNSVFLSDLDNDGDNDLIKATAYGDTVVWYENLDGQGGFSNSNVLMISPGPPYTENGAQAVISADLNNDGFMDIISVSKETHTITWFENLGILGNRIDGLVTIDIDSDICDANAYPGANLMISTSNGNNSFSTFTQEDGSYQIPVNEGDFVTSMMNSFDYFIASPESFTSNFSGLGNTSNGDFCLTRTGDFNDLIIALYPLNEARPGFDSSYELVYTNSGSTLQSGSIDIEFDVSKMQFLSASETVANQTANTLNFNYSNLVPFETRTIILDFNVFAPPVTEINDELEFTATINPVSGDDTEVDNTFTLDQTVVGSYDPNDIRVLEGDQILHEDIDKYLHYIIRFQNTGTASAINVSVEHILDTKLDWTTMQLESLSHEGRVEIIDGSAVSFNFYNINLPDSTNDEPNSHGYIAFKIKPKADVLVGDIIDAVANIYFDFNPPIITNTAQTEIVDNLSVSDVEAQRYWMYPNPTTDILHIKSQQNFDHIRILDINGRIIETISLEGLQSTYQLHLESLGTGMYFLEIGSSHTTTTLKFIKQ